MLRIYHSAYIPKSPVYTKTWKRLLSRFFNIKPDRFDRQFYMMDDKVFVDRFAWDNLPGEVLRDEVGEYKALKK